MTISPRRVISHCHHNDCMPRTSKSTQKRHQYCINCYRHTAKLTANAVDLATQLRISFPRPATLLVIWHVRFPSRPLSGRSHTSHLQLNSDLSPTLHLQQVHGQPDGECHGPGRTAAHQLPRACRAAGGCGLPVPPGEPGAGGPEPLPLPGGPGAVRQGPQAPVRVFVSEVYLRCMCMHGVAALPELGLVSFLEQKPP